jgi:hypothetical protein
VAKKSRKRTAFVVSVGIRFPEASTLHPNLTPVFAGRAGALAGWRRRIHMPIAVLKLGSPRKPNEGLRLGTVRRPPRGVPKTKFAKLDFYDV